MVASTRRGFTATIPDGPDAKRVRVLRRVERAGSALGGFNTPMFTDDIQPRMRHDANVTPNLVGLIAVAALVLAVIVFVLVAV